MNCKIINKEPIGDVVIRFQDCDPFGHLNNARYIDYFINERENHLLQYYNFDTYYSRVSSNQLFNLSYLANQYILLSVNSYPTIFVLYK